LTVGAERRAKEHTVLVGSVRSASSAEAAIHAAAEEAELALIAMR
jgi:hypothetical protein